MSQAYGQRLAEALNARGSAFVTKSRLEHSRIAVTQIRCDVADGQFTAPVASEDAVLVMLQLRAWPKRNLWADDHFVEAAPLDAGAISIFDLRTKWIGHRVCPIHQVNFYLPRAALDEIMLREGGKPVREFANDPLRGTEDQTVHALARTLLPAFERPEEANQLFVDHITTATAAHVLKRYGVGAKLADATGRGFGKRDAASAESTLEANLGGKISIDQLAAECRMPVSEFVSAFKTTFGTTPHRWLLDQRVSRAMALLSGPSRPLDEIALATGFASATHLSRVFKNRIGVLPADWRNIKRH